MALVVVGAREDAAAAEPEPCGCAAAGARGGGGGALGRRGGRHVGEQQRCQRLEIAYQFLRAPVRAARRALKHAGRVVGLAERAAAVVRAAAGGRGAEQLRQRQVRRRLRRQRLPRGHRAQQRRAAAPRRRQHKLAPRLRARKHPWDAVGEARRAPAAGAQPRTAGSPQRRPPRRHAGALGRRRRRRLLERRRRREKRFRVGKGTAVAPGGRTARAATTAKAATCSDHTVRSIAFTAGRGELRPEGA